MRLESTHPLMTRPSLIRETEEDNACTGTPILVPVGQRANPRFVLPESIRLECATFVRLGDHVVVTGPDGSPKAFKVVTVRIPNEDGIYVGVLEETK